MKSKVTVLITSIVFTIILFLPLAVGAQSGYQPLIGEAPELGIVTGAGSTNLANFLTKMFAVLISITGVLGVLMLVIGGIQYMTTDAVFKKSLGKQRILSATGGIILALSSWIILNTINPDLLTNEIDLGIEVDTQQDPGNIGLTGFQIGVPVPKHIVDQAYSSLSPEESRKILGNREEFDNLSLSQQIRLLEQAGQTNVQQRSKLNAYINQEGSDMAKNILTAAQAAANYGLRTCGTHAGAQTEGGRLACAYTVNHIIEAATGRAIDNGVSTATMAKNLSTDSRFQNVGSNLSSARPGDIVISPTEADRAGHVGIVETAGASSIISNSSNNKEVQRHFSADSWTRRYVDQQNLEVQIYRSN